MTEEVGRHGTPPSSLENGPYSGYGVQETIFWLEREIARSRSGDPPTQGGDSIGEEMAELMEQRRCETGSQ